MKKPRTDSGVRAAARNGSTADRLDVITHSGTAAFATDESGCITVWNRAAEALLGYPAPRVLGKRCHEILCGVDLFGNHFCNRQCALSCMVEAHQPVRHFEMDVRAESGAMIPTGFSIVVLPGARAGQYTMIHFMEKVDRQQEVSALIHRILTDSQPEPVSAISVEPPSAPPAPLTSREIEVLRLLADGTSTQDIASSLFISVPTARNHVQNILRKLDVHSKLEAVSLALRNHLL
ncbi:MAG TPA: LuxR C-terminal-related transcriptional regulator [Candidatus Krumholzibacteria bacterium]|nr:LuxR C-terminal-related transcriptional regulator [Candidatus Krumholzibacteria bacterium]